MHDLLDATSVPSAQVSNFPQVVRLHRSLPKRERLELLCKSRLIIRSIDSISSIHPPAFPSPQTHLNGDTLPNVAVTGALLGAGIVSIPLSSNTVFDCGTGANPFPFSVPASSRCCAPLPPTDLPPRFSAPGRFFFPDGPGVTAAAGVGAGATVPLLGVSPTLPKPGIGAGLEAMRLGPIMGSGSASAGGGGASAAPVKPSPLMFLFLRIMGVAMICASVDFERRFTRRCLWLCPMFAIRVCCEILISNPEISLVDAWRRLVLT